MPLLCTMPDKGRSRVLRVSLGCKWQHLRSAFLLLSHSILGIVIAYLIPDNDVAGCLYAGACAKMALMFLTYNSGPAQLDQAVLVKMMRTGGSGAMRKRAKSAGTIREKSKQRDASELLVGMSAYRKFYT